MFQSFILMSSFVVNMNAKVIIKPVSIKLQHRTNDIVGMGVIDLSKNM